MSRPNAYVVTADHTAEGPVVKDFATLSAAMAYVDQCKACRNPKFSTGEGIGLYRKVANGETTLLRAWADRGRQWVKIYSV